MRRYCIGIPPSENRGLKITGGGSRGYRPPPMLPPILMTFTGGGGDLNESS
jgi:hypothetical protein